MKHLKTLWLVAVVAAGLVAFSAPASATSLTSPEGTTYTGTVKATSVDLKLDGSFVTVECSHSSAETTIEQHGELVLVGGNVSNFTVTSCNFPVHVNKGGKAEVASGGKLMSSGGEVSITTSIGTCIFSTSNTLIGTGTGTKGTGGNAKLHIGAAKIPRTEGSFLCGSSGTLTGSYTINTPSTLFLD